jgi:hypothetical protein
MVIASADSRYTRMNAVPTTTASLVPGTFPGRPMRGWSASRPSVWATASRIASVAEGLIVP